MENRLPSHGHSLSLLKSKNDVMLLEQQSSVLKLFLKHWTLSLAGPIKQVQNWWLKLTLKKKSLLTVSLVIQIISRNFLIYLQVRNLTIWFYKHKNWGIRTDLPQIMQAFIPFTELCKKKELTLNMYCKNKSIQHQCSYVR